MPHRNRNIPTQTMPPPKPDLRPSRAPKSTPWQHMADTYAWVVEQEYVKLDKHGRNTEQWIREQQIRFPEGRARHEFGERVRRRMWEDTMYRYEAEAERWMRQEEEMRRIAAERERRRAKAMQEEVRRVEEQIRQQRDAERRKRTEEYHYYRRPTQRRVYERSRSDKSLSDSWKRYEDRWATLAASSEPLTFTNIPWPLASPPTSPEQITLSAVSEFLLSPLHSQSLTRKDRIRNAQLRWHPDRFQRMMHRVPSIEKAIVTEGVGAVARSLNELMSREKVSSRPHVSLQNAFERVSS
ncbi:hypothetical protein Moror_6388 [Moniliophthora roreri MCA 2997]|uniref:Uncharacterized protein n=1 Tax=Moniliophthora roreri (strain MCA 2997) TaxID=1381753 RepID=V2XVX5_MONRO|nr:hypothetical protein Moror_6388 [Moniliophthora roreri MCA 2997]